jgi:hypothetical protein
MIFCAPVAAGDDKDDCRETTTFVEEIGERYQKYVKDLAARDKTTTAQMTDLQLFDLYFLTEQLHWHGISMFYSCGPKPSITVGPNTRKITPELIDTWRSMHDDYGRTLRARLK